MDSMVKMARFQIKQNVLNLKSTLQLTIHSLVHTIVHSFIKFKHFIQDYATKLQVSLVQQNKQKRAMKIEKSY